MFLDRKKRVTNSRVLAFTKRLVNVAIQLQSEPALVILTAAKSLLSVSMNYCIYSAAYWRLVAMILLKTVGSLSGKYEV